MQKKQTLIVIHQVSFARPSSETIKFANLYICGIPKQWTTKELESYFNSCGKIITSRILVDPNTGVFLFLIARYQRMNTYVCSIYDFEFFCRFHLLVLRLNQSNFPIFIFPIFHRQSLRRNSRIYLEISVVLFHQRFFPVLKQVDRSDLLHVDKLNRIIDFKIQQNV